MQATLLISFYRLFSSFSCTVPCSDVLIPNIFDVTLSSNFVCLKFGDNLIVDYLSIKLSYDEIRKRVILGLKDRSIFSFPIE